MSPTTFILAIITFIIIAIITVVIVLRMLNKKAKQTYNKEITGLERDKNMIISASILSELNKVEALLNNENLKNTYGEWQVRFKEIKDKEVPKLTDQLVEIEELHHAKKYKELKKQMAKVELNIYYIKTKANFLLEEIKEITLSEERNREAIIKLKTAYREIMTKYNNAPNDYNEIKGAVELQFENTDKLFSAFELAMEKNSYTEVPKIVKAIDDIVGNLTLIIEESPTIILMGKKLIPHKINDINNIYQKMQKDGFNLEYLNIPYNIEEAEKKITDIFGRLNVLNVEDSIFELKTMADYFDSLYNDFDNERISKNIYEDYARNIIIKIIKLEKINNQLYKRIGDIRHSYDLTDGEVKEVEKLKTDLKQLKANYEKTVELHRNKVSSFTKLAKEMELLNVKLTKVEETLEKALRTFGSLKEDELRAREQLDEIKDLLKQTKVKITSYKLPSVPKKYYVELAEATEAIKNINKELDKKPISIKILNTRVDTARDLVLKLYATTKETVKTAWMAETAIVYGNRYRPVNKEIDLGLLKAENAFFKGNYKNALENAINSINLVEPGIHKRLIAYYEQ